MFSVFKQITDKIENWSQKLKETSKRKFWNLNNIYQDYKTNAQVITADWARLRQNQQL